MFVAFAALALAAALATADSATNLVVQTEYGHVKGVLLDVLGHPVTVRLANLTTQTLIRQRI